MEVRITILTLAVAAVNFANGKPIFRVPVDPDVEPARESQLMVSKYLLKHAEVICLSMQELFCVMLL